MTSYLLAGPATEPVSLLQAKAFLRVDDSAEDNLISTLIAAARIHVESVTGRALIEQTWRVVLDDWPVDRIVKLPVAPLMSLTLITAYDAEGNGTAVSLAEVLPETNVAPARLFLPRSFDEAPLLRARQAIEIDYVAGFGDEADDVPSALTQAILALVGYWFEHRDAVVMAGSGAVVPAGFDRLLSPYRQVAL